MDFYIGVDLGTTQTRVAVWIPEEESVRIIGTYPTCLFFSQDNGEHFGTEAVVNNIVRPFNTIFAVRRLIGMKNLELEYKSKNSIWESKIQFQNSDPNDEARFCVRLQDSTLYFSTIDVTAKMLAKLKEAAEADHKVGRPITGVVLSVPSFFTDSQRRATKKAATKAGFTFVRLLNETSAVAIHYGVNQQLVLNAPERNVLIFDLGGGSLSLSVVGMRYDGNRLRFQVKYIGGNPLLGGKDIEDGIMQMCIDRFLKSFNIDIKEFQSDRQDDTTAEGVARSLSRLRIECHNAKIALSSGDTPEVTIEVQSFYKDNNLVCKLTRDDFEKVCEKLLKECRGAIIDCLKVTQLHQDDIHNVILCGGTTRIMRIQRLLKGGFGTKVLEGPIEEGVIPEESVVRGAAMQAFLLCPVPPETPVNTIARADRASLQEVTPYDIGFECTRDGGINNSIRTLIGRNTQIPATRDYFCLTEMKQTNAKIRVYEGVHGWEKSYKLLGVCTMGIPPEAQDPKTNRNEFIYTNPGLRRIKAPFEIDSDGILSVASAVDNTPGMLEQVCTVKIEKGRFNAKEIEVVMLGDAGNEPKKRSMEDGEDNAPNKKAKQ